jgi:hypothetical protein
MRTTLRLILAGLLIAGATVYYQRYSQIADLEDRFAALEAEVHRQHMEIVILTDPSTIQERTVNMQLGQPYGPGRYVH